jgi:hypothetical protein
VSAVVYNRDFGGIWSAENRWLADTQGSLVGYLSQEISQYYKAMSQEDHSEGTEVCPPFHEFVKRWQDLDKITGSNVFAI